MLIFRKSKRRFGKWESQLIERYEGQNKILDVFEVSKQQCRPILVMSFYDSEEPVSLQPTAGSCHVLSSSESFNEENEIDYEGLTNWLTYYGLPQYHVHVSGHMMPLRLKATLREINADRVFLIHTDHAEFAKFMRDPTSQVTLVEKCIEYTV